MQKAAPEVHAGAESTGPNGGAPAAGIAGRSARLASDVADKLTGSDNAPAYEDTSKEELLELVREADIEGRSNMNKHELTRSLRSLQKQQGTRPRPSARRQRASRSTAAPVARA
jgi:non-homologous end joining protein Ku